MSIGPEHRRALRTETVVPVAINGLVPAGIIGLIDLAPLNILLDANGITAFSFSTSCSGPS